MINNMKSIRYFLLLLPALFVMCSSTRHTVKIEPVNSDKPVSASSFILNRQGEILGPESYDIVKHVDYIWNPLVKIGGNKNVALSLTDSLLPSMNTWNADGIVNLKIIERVDDKSPVPEDVAMAAAKSWMRMIFIPLGCMLSSATATILMPEDFKPAGSLIGIGLTAGLLYYILRPGKASIPLMVSYDLISIKTGSVPTIPRAPDAPAAGSAVQPAQQIPAQPVITMPSPEIKPDAEVSAPGALAPLITGNMTTVVIKNGSVYKGTLVSQSLMSIEVNVQGSKIRIARSVIQSITQ